MTTFKRICAWCKKSLGPDKIVDDGKKKVEKTHGVCKNCSKDL